MNKRRRASSYYRRKKGENDGPSLKAICFIVVIAFSLAMRFAEAGPLFTAREKITSVLNSNIDISQAAETLGRAFTGGQEDGEESAVLVFGKMILGIEDEKEPESKDKSADLSSPTDSSDISPVTSISNTMAGAVSGLTFDVAESPFPQLTPEYIDCGFTEEEAYDGTPNEAFEIPSPDVVDDTVYTMDFKKVMPLKSYRITSYFGYRIHPISGNTTFHYGVDLAASAGNRIYVIADGTVSETGYGSINGNYIKISHSDGFASHYAHLKDIKVKKGQKLSAGDVIGTVGSTGYSTGPHLHFEVRKNGMVVDPFDYFSF